MNNTYVVIINGFLRPNFLLSEVYFHSNKTVLEVKMLDHTYMCIHQNNDLLE